MYSPLEPSVATSTTSDEALMQAIIARDQDALTKLYERYRALLGKIVAEILPVDGDVQETIQDVFAEVWIRAENFDFDKGKPLGWMITMARRRAIDRYRKLLRHSVGREKLRNASEALPGSVHGLGTLEEELDGETSAATNDLRAFLTHALRSLPTEQGQVVYLTYFEDLSQRTIAARTGIPLGTIKTRLDLAMRKLTIKFAGLRTEIQYAH